MADGTIVLPSLVNGILHQSPQVLLGLSPFGAGATVFPTNNVLENRSNSGGSVSNSSCRSLGLAVGTASTQLYPCSLETPLEVADPPYHSNFTSMDHFNTSALPNRVNRSSHTYTHQPLAQDSSRVRNGKQISGHQSNLSGHAKSQSLICVCGTTFKRRSELRRHQKSVHRGSNKSRWQCGCCQNSSLEFHPSRKDGVVQHFRKSHGLSNITHKELLKCPFCCDSADLEVFFPFEHCIQEHYEREHYLGGVPTANTEGMSYPSLCKQTFSRSKHLHRRLGKSARHATQLTDTMIALLSSPTIVGTAQAIKSLCSLWKL